VLRLRRSGRRAALQFSERVPVSIQAGFGQWDRDPPRSPQALNNLYIVYYLEHEYPAIYTAGPATDMCSTSPARAARVSASFRQQKPREISSKLFSESP
jgi:hypothetical protein